MWVYEIPTGKMFAPDGSVAGVGYAGGFCGKVPEAINNLAFVSVKNTGPLPPGWYTMDEPVDHTRLGPMAIPLIPDESNEMYDRDSFYCHGDTPTPRMASDGCIVQNAATRELMISSEDKRLQVVPTFNVPVISDQNLGK